MNVRPALLAAALCAWATLASAAGPESRPAFQSLDRQLATARVVPGRALERLIRANQDFSLLRPEEAKDKLLLPPWLRVWWRKNHPEGRYDGSDPTGGYPLVLREILEWMTTHQDLVPGVGDGEGDEPAGAPFEREAVAVSGETRISGAQTSPRSESDIRVNPWDPTRIVAAANNISASGRQAQFYSSDTGATWGQTELGLQPGDAFHSDPTVDWTSDGTAWSTTLGINANLRVQAYKSIDGGATWTFDATASGAQIDTDKQMIWVDHSATSPFKDTLYATWHNGSPVYVNHRTGPAGSWQTPIQVSGLETTGTGIGGDIKSNADGHVFAFWPDTGSRRLFVAKSTDGGVSFGAPVKLAQTFDSYDIGVPSFAGRRALIYVSGGAYKTAGRNLVYATWTDLSGVSGCNQPANEPGTNVLSACKTRVWFARSTDGGATWEAARKLNDQPSLDDQFNQWLAVDEATGALGVVYYDTIGDAGRKKVDVWYQASYDDGATWTAAAKVTSTPTDETTAGSDSANQFGDYNALSGYLGVFFPTWTDRRAGLPASREEIWTAKIDDPSCTPPGAPTIGTATAPAGNQIQVTWTNGVPAAAAFDVYRAFGTCASPGTFSSVATGVAGSPYTDSTVSGGSTYAYRLTGRDATGHCESALSGCAEATATGACTLPPTFAGIVSATNAASATCRTHLEWNPGSAPCGGLVRYNVYRGIPGFTPDGSNRIASSVVATTFDDAAQLLDGVAYEYIVQAIDIGNGVADSNTVRRSATPSGSVTFAAFSETFEGAGGFDHAGWSHGALSGPGDWALSTARAQSPTHSWFSADAEPIGDRVLTSPSFVAEAGTSLSFWHTRAFETSGGQCFDGGTLEVTTDGSTWSVLPDAAFTSGGFDGTITAGLGNPIGGVRAWCGGTVGALTQVTADLSSFAGSTLRLRWHEGDDDGNATAATGWYVDSVSATGFGTAGVCSTATAATRFYTLTPCRVLDTRAANGTYGGPAFAPGSTRGFPFAGVCGIPADAKAVSVNITITSPTAAGFVTAYAAALNGAPATSVLNFGPGTTRANNAVVMVATDGSNDVKIVNGSAGTVQVLVDVNGYFK